MSAHAATTERAPAHAITRPPLHSLPDGLTPDQTVDLCNYTALTEVVTELTKVVSGFYTFGELKTAIATFAARADEIANGRWPLVDRAAMTPSAVLAAAPSPATAAGDAGEESPAPEEHDNAPSNPPAPDTTDQGEGDGAGQDEPPPDPAPPPQGDNDETASSEDAPADDNDDTATTPEPRAIDETQLIPAVTG